MVTVSLATKTRCFRRESLWSYPRKVTKSLFLLSFPCLPGWSLARGTPDGKDAPEGANWAGMSALRETMKLTGQDETAQRDRTQGTLGTL